MTLFGVKELKTTGSDPKANGLTEKCNELIIIKNYSTSYVFFAEQDWELCFLEVTLTCNSSVHFLTGFTPARPMFERNI